MYHIDSSSVYFFISSSAETHPFINQFIQSHVSALQVGHFKQKKYLARKTVLPVGKQLGVEKSRVLC